VVIGVIDHHTLQIERPDQVADLIREALRHVAPERLIISSDCGMGREGMSRRHAQYKMVAMVLGTNMVRKNSGFRRPNVWLLTPDIPWRCDERHPARTVGRYRNRDRRTMSRTPSR